jgi:hypothetical protein
MSHSLKISQIEKEIARKIIQNEAEIFSFEFIKECLRRNDDLIRIPKVKNFTLVGGGSIPTTIIKASQLDKFDNFEVIDIDDEAIFLGRLILEKQGLVGNYINCGGEDFNFENSDAVYIANLAQSKAEILEQCFKTLLTGNQVILRLSTSNNLDDVDTFFQEQIDQRKWTIESYGDRSIEFNSYNVFLRKN